MNSTEYIAQCKRTETTGSIEGDIEYGDKVNARMTSTEGQRGIHACLGLATETGELVDAIKRYIRYGKPVDAVNIKEEFGDICWYMALIADQYGFTFEDAMNSNVEKLLKKRYKNGFSENAALNRDLTEERKALES